MGRLKKRRKLMSTKRAVKNALADQRIIYEVEKRSIVAMYATHLAILRQAMFLRERSKAGGTVFEKGPELIRTKDYGEKN